MSLHTLSRPRFFTRSKRQAEAQPERVEGVYMQEQSCGSVLSDPPGDSVKGQNSLPAGTVLAEYTCTACRNSAAATTLFIP